MCDICDERKAMAEQKQVELGTLSIGRTFRNNGSVYLVTDVHWGTTDDRLILCAVLYPPEQAGRTERIRGGLLVEV